ncbi:hypothetical protein H310_06328 [Aphanomyces invadans]|uniref:Uncharacterized protein n=1 Tax=Aphanomyces invadans TaxID=157072 RepID=A0A024U749_9STRA|nr:hypothetical protein H310_06328 [Aphanomyces invadans]ETW01722.1 hypothetical protein H310_06328 [Aphanomyces invadans]|eukprot:XP_008869570.1 hypothetical protein H310_06328 [Aphanomyces invadans]
MVTNLVNVDAKTYRDYVLNKVVPVKMAKFPSVGKRVVLQLNNATPHCSIDDRALAQVSTQRLTFVAHRQPPNSPDLSFLDLCILASIQTQQYKKLSRTVDDAIASKMMAFNSLGLGERVPYSANQDSSDEAAMALLVEDCDAHTVEHHIVIDSGASVHMTGAADHFTPSTLTLTDVLLIEEMTSTLLSVPALMHANPKIRVEFQCDACIILLGSKAVARSTVCNDQRLYILEGVFTHESTNSTATVTEQTALSHHRIGHLPIEARRTCSKAGLGLPIRITDMD